MLRVPTSSATAIATHGIATAALADPGDNHRWAITRILGSVGGGSALVVVLDGSTVLWQGIATSNAPISESFDPPLEGTASSAVSCVVADAGVGNVCTASIQAVFT